MAEMLATVKSRAKVKKVEKLNDFQNSFITGKRRKFPTKHVSFPTKP